MNDKWSDLLAEKLAENGDNDDVDEDLYAIMLKSFANRVLEDFVVDASTNEMTKRTTRVREHPPDVTDTSENYEGGLYVSGEVCHLPIILSLMISY